MLRRRSATRQARTAPASTAGPSSGEGLPIVPPLVQEREREDQHEKLLPWHYKLAKLIDCEIYQASEDATRKDPLLLALIDFSRVYTHFLVSNTADYNAAPWGTI